ncbi:MAG: YcxB family protein [Hyphomicrobiales bacterium]
MIQEYKISEDEYVEAMRLGTNSKLLFVSLATVVAIAVIFEFGFVNTDPSLVYVVAYVFGISLIVYAVYVAVMRFAVTQNFRKHYRQYKLIQSPMTMEVVEDGVHFTSDLANSRLEWDHFTGWREDDRYILLYVAPRMFHIVPKRISEDGFDVDRFRARLTETLGPPI